MLFTNCFLNAVYLALDDIINVFSAHICFVCKGQKVKFLIFHMKERIITCVFKKKLPGKCCVCTIWKLF